MNQNLFYITALLVTQLFFAQKKESMIPDTLKNKSYSYLDERIYSLKGDSSKASIYLYTYLNKAKKEQNAKELVNGYQNILHESPDALRLLYADSMIYAAQNSKQNELIGSAYLSKGIVYYGRKELQKALDHYLTSNQYLSKTTDEYLNYKVKYNIAIIKTYLGYYEEAITLLRQCITYFKNTNERPYLNSLHALGLCYNKIGNYGQCSQTNTLGLEESTRLDNKEMVPYFIHSEGINQFFRENYNQAIQELNTSLESIAKTKDFASTSIAHFYIGKSLWKLKKYDAAVPYFQKVDRFYRDKNYIRPDLREAYELLIQYYKTKNNLNAQLYCINRLLQADDDLNESYKYLVSKIHKEYDTKELVLEKEKIHQQFLKQRQRVYIFIGIAILLFSISFFLTYKHFTNRRIYKKNFEEFMASQNSGNKEKSKLKSDKKPILDIHPETVTAILKLLERFEKDKKFLEKDLTLSRMASQFNTNPRYLSVIIAHYKDLNFSQYINNLKIDHIVNLLQNDKKVRNYTNEAMAAEAGFSSTQRFAHAFLARTGMPTSFFIEHIKKEIILS